MSYATLEQFTARVPGGIFEDDEPRAQAALDDVTAVVNTIIPEEIKEEWTAGPVPPEVVAVVCGAAQRAFVNPLGHASVTEGAYTWRADNLAGVWLSAAEQSVVRRAAGIPGWSQVEKVTEYGFELFPSQYLTGI